MVAYSLQDTYQRLKELNDIDIFFYSYYQQTGNYCAQLSTNEIEQFLQQYVLPNQQNSLDHTYYNTIKDIKEFCRVILSEDGMFPSGRDVILSKSVRYCKLQEHKHDYFEIECVLNGDGLHSSNNRKLRVNTGDVIIIPPHLPHDLTVVDDSTIVNIGMRKSTFRKAFKQMLESKFPLAQYFLKILHSENYRNPLIFHCGKDDYWLTLLLAIASQHMENNQYSDLIIKHLTQAWLHYIIQTYPPQHPFPIANHELERMDAIYDYICKNFQTVSLQSIAQQFSLSKPYLCTIIKHFFGMTFSALLRTTRLQHACELLRETDMSVTIICHTVGYSEESYFIKIFKKEFGITPKQYQLQNRVTSGNAINDGI